MMYYEIGGVVFCSDKLSEQFEPFRVNYTPDHVDVSIKPMMQALEDQEYVKVYQQIKGYEIRERADGSWLYIFTESHIQLLVNQTYSVFNYYTDSMENADFIEILIVAIRCRLLLNGILVLHAACIDRQGEAIAFSAPSGIGKSTRANHWITQCNAQWLSGDRPCVDVKNGQIITGPWDGKEQIIHAVNRPLRYICEVRRAPFTRIRRLSDAQAYAFLIKQIFVPMWDSNLVMMSMVLLRRLIRSIEVVRLFCDQTEAAACETENYLFYDKEQFKKEVEEMKLKEGFVIRCIADEYMAIPTGDSIQNFSGVVVLNGVSAFILEHMQNPISKEDLVDLIVAEYDVAPEIAEKDLGVLIEKFQGYGMIE